MSEVLNDRYVIEREIGHGGMASVFQAQDVKHGRSVALKLLRSELTTSIDGDRFLREIEIVAGLTHPHILSLHDSGEIDDRLFYVMPLVEEGSLRARLDRDGPLPVDRAIRYAKEVAEALDYAHRHGVIHRDIKPGNIMLSGGHALVADFGIASLVTGEQLERLTRSGISLGTPLYMSPEQSGGESLTPAADVYSLGCVLYEMLAGEPPFGGRNAAAVQARHALAPIPDVTAVRPSVPEWVQAVIERALAKVPVDRFSSAGEMARALEGEGAPDRLRAGRRIARLSPPLRGKAGRIAAVVAAVVLVVVAMALPFTRGDAGQAGEDPSALVPKLDENAVVIVPTVIRGSDTSAAFLRDGLAGLLAPFLDGIAAPRAVDLAEVDDALGAAGLSWEDELTMEDAREIAAGLGAGLVLRSNLVGTPGQSVVSAELLDVTDGNRIAEARVVVHPDSLAQMSDQLISELFVDYLDEEVRAEQLLSHDPEALRAYAAGLRVRRGGDALGALKHFERAVDIDSTFALAALGFLDARVWAPDNVVPLETMERMRDVVARHRSSVGDTKADSLIALIRAGGPQSGLERLELLREAVRVAPDRAETWFNLGDFLYHDGAMLEIPNFVDSALVAMEAALDLDSTNDELIGHVMSVALFRRDTAILGTWNVEPLESPEDFKLLSWQAAHVLGDTATIASVDRLLPQFENGQYSRMIRLAPRTGLGLRQADRAAALLDSAIYSSSPEQADGTDDWVPFRPWYLAIDVYYYWLNRGQPLKAADIVRRAQAAAGWTVFKRMALAEVVTGVVDTTVAREVSGPLRVHADSLARALDVAEPSEPEIDYRRRAGLTLALCSLQSWEMARGDTTRSQREIKVLRRLEATADSVSVRNHARLCADFLGVSLSFEREEPDIEGLYALDSLLATKPAGVNRVYLQRYGLALSYRLAEIGDHERALAATMRRGYDVEENYYLAAMILQQARMQAQLGDVGSAIESYERYLTLVDGADRYARVTAEIVRRELAGLR